MRRRGSAARPFVGERGRARAAVRGARKTVNSHREPSHVGAREALADAPARADIDGDRGPFAAPPSVRKPFMFTTSPLVRSAALALIAACAAGAAHAVPIVVGSYANTGIGAEFASPYDNFYVNGKSLDVALTSGSSTVLALADYAFEVGPNCYSCNCAAVVPALISVSVGGVTRQLDLSTLARPVRSIRSLSPASHRSASTSRTAARRPCRSPISACSRARATPCAASSRHAHRDRGAGAFAVDADGRRPRRRRLDQAPTRLTGRDRPLTRSQAPSRAARTA